MKLRHTYVSPTMDLMAKKILGLPDVTAKFIREILDLPVQSVEILEGNQIHTPDYSADEEFFTLVDVRARLDNGTEVIIEIQVVKQDHFLNRFHYYLASQLVENIQQRRLQGQIPTHQMYKEMEPVYGIAILEKSIFPHEPSPINVYEMRHINHGGPLLSTYKDGKEQNLLRVAFLELDKYNENEKEVVTTAQRQWLEFFGNRPFSQEPDRLIQAADSLLEPVNWTKEERDMIDERIRNRENYELNIATAKREGRDEARLDLARTLAADGFEASYIAKVLKLSEEEIHQLLSDN